MKSMVNIHDIWIKRKITTMLPIMAVVLASVAPMGCGDCDGALNSPPSPCKTDQDCIEAFGPTWYCNQDNTVTDSCNGEVKWPSCVDRCDRSGDPGATTPPTAECPNTSLDK